MKVKIYQNNKIKVLTKASKILRVINIIFELDNKGYYKDLYYYDNGVLEALTSDIDNDDEELEV